MLNFLPINQELELYCCESLLSQPFHFPDDLAYSPGVRMGKNFFHFYFSFK